MGKTKEEKGLNNYGNERIKDVISDVSEAVLKLLVGGGALGAALIAPNIVQVLDKPLARYFERLDARARDRQLRRSLYYLKRKGWVATSTGNYEHSIQITAKGKLRLERLTLNELAIAQPKAWDKKWRVVFFDIPETKKAGRNALASKLKSLGFYTLQRSVLVHPFPCRAEVAAVAAAYDIAKYVSYIETDHIDQAELLIKKFQNLLQ